MLRTLTFLAWIPLVWQPACGQPPSIRKDNNRIERRDGKLGASQTQQDKRGTKESPLFVEAHDRPKTDEEIAEAKADKERADYVNTWTVRFTGLGAVSTFVLILVGAGGVWAAMHTLRHIRAQTDAIQRQVNVMAMQTDLMQAQMSQWVTFGNWRSSLIQRIGPLSPQPRRIRIEFEIVNPSNFPLTLDGVFRFNGIMPEAPKLIVPGGIISPGRPYPLGVDVTLTDDQAKSYVNEGLRISLHGEYSHVGPSKQRSPIMEIHANVVCHLSSPTITEFETTNEKQPSRQSAN